MDKIEIPLNKTKLIFSVAFTFLVVLTGIWLFIEAEETAKTTVFLLFQNPMLNRLVSVLVVLVFAWLTFYGAKKIFNNKIGLTIDDNGVTDNSGILSIGFINWNEITEIKTATYENSKFLLVFVKDPAIALNNAKGLKKKMMEGNMNNYGTPLSISPNTLKCNFDELEKLLQERLKEKTN